MVDVRGDVLRPPNCTSPAAVKANNKKIMSSFKSNENIHKKEDGSYYVVSASKASLNTERQFVDVCQRDSSPSKTRSVRVSVSKLFWQLINKVSAQSLRHFSLV